MHRWFSHKNPFPAVLFTCSHRFCGSLDFCSCLSVCACLYSMPWHPILIPIKFCTGTILCNGTKHLLARSPLSFLDASWHLAWSPLGEVPYSLTYAVGTLFACVILFLTCAFEPKNCIIIILSPHNAPSMMSSAQTFIVSQWKSLGNLPMRSWDGFYQWSISVIPDVGLYIVLLISWKLY